MPPLGFEPAILATKEPRPTPYTARPAGLALGTITGTEYPDQLRNYQLLNKDFFPMNTAVTVSAKCGP
jgi:hypothetical protein